MIEFIKKEVWCMEESEVSRHSLLSFFLNGHKDALVVLQNNGVFCKYLTYESLLYDIPGGEHFAVIGEDIFQSAGEFFASRENRVKMLPVVNDRGELLSFMCWNNQKRGKPEPDQDGNEIEKEARIFIRECNETVYLWLQDYLKKHSGKEVVLAGEGWEVLVASQVIFSKENKVSLDDREDGLFELTFGKVPRIKVNSIESMWKIKDAYLGYRIFVWLEDKDDLDMFTKLTFSGIRVEGFCNDQQESVRDFLGKAVVDLCSVMDEPDVMVVRWKEKEKVEIKEKYPKMSALCISYKNLFEMRNEMWEKEAVIFYDSRKEAEKVAEVLQKANVRISGCCSAISKTGDVLCGESLFSLEDLIENAGKINIVLAIANGYCEKIVERLRNMDLNVFVPSEDVLYASAFSMLLGNMGWYLDRAWRKNKKIVIYGARTCFTNPLLTFFHTNDMQVYRILDISVKEEENIESIYELAYEEPEETFVIINKNIDECVASCELVEGLGFSHFNENYAGLYAVGYQHPEGRKDVVLGYVTNPLAENSKYPGFSIFGEENPGDYRIVMLGGSTTASEAYRVPCWPQLLYHKFAEEGKHITIYNGAIDGYTAANELYKLIRDVRCLKPDLIISFSGVNNIFSGEYPYVPPYMFDIFYGICGDDYVKGLKDDTMTAAQAWVQQEQMMEAISRFVYGAQFVCFIQPTYFSKNWLSPSERLKFEVNRDCRKYELAFRRETAKMALQFEWMIDLQGILDDRPEVFLDTMHVYEEGNRIIADAVYREIKKYFEEA